MLLQREIMKNVFVLSAFLFCFGNSLQAMNSCLLAPGFLMLIKINQTAQHQYLKHEYRDELQPGCYLYKNGRMDDSLLVQVHVISVEGGLEGWNYMIPTRYNIYNFTADGQNFFLTQRTSDFRSIPDDFSRKKVAQKDYTGSGTDYTFVQNYFQQQKEQKQLRTQIKMTQKRTRKKDQQFRYE